MADPVPHLKLVDTRTGEAHDQCEGCMARDAAIERLTRSYEGTIRNLKSELEQELGVEPEADAVRRVLNLWADAMLDCRWYSRRPKFRAGDDRWKPVRKRLREGYSEEYLGVVVEAVRFADADRVKRQWLEPKTLFGAHMESRYEDVLAGFRGPVWVPSEGWLRTELWKREMGANDAGTAEDV
jgi:uncharacterized phage protein (TIGR02220 family)